MTRSAPLPLLRTSERVAFKRCRWKWHVVYNLGVTRRGAGPALRFGDVVHRSLATWYVEGRKRGPHPVETFRVLYADDLEKNGPYLQRDTEDERVDPLDLGIDMLDNYVETYGRDTDIFIIHPEHPFSYPFVDAGGRRWLYVGRFDALARVDGLLTLLEHKTSKDLKTEHLPLDEQAGSYWAWAPQYLRQIGVMKKGEQLDGILYNFLRKQVRDARPANEAGLYLNKDGSVSKKQPAPYFDRTMVYRDAHDRRQVVRRIRIEAAEMRLVREGKLLVYKNPTKDCSWDCPLYDVCELHETGSDWREVVRQHYDVTDPYEEYKTDLGLEAKRGNNDSTKVYNSIGAIVEEFD